jgi:hypothetical protein
MTTRDWNCALSLSAIDPERIMFGKHLGHGVMWRHVSDG